MPFSYPVQSQILLALRVDLEILGNRRKPGIHACKLPIVRMEKGDVFDAVVAAECQISKRVLLIAPRACVNIRALRPWSPNTFYRLTNQSLPKKSKEAWATSG